MVQSKVFFIFTEIIFTRTKVDIIRPTFILNEKICSSNIRQMAQKAKMNNLIFRPHFKTHQSKTIGNWFKENGVNKIAVSSVQMAEYFANAGWTDILIAFPVNLPEIGQINNLLRKVKLHLLVESDYSTNYLNKNLTGKTGIYIKIDTGYHRTGIASNDFNEIKKILKIIRNSENLEFTGLLTHAGHTYNCKSKEEIIKIHNDSINQLKIIKNYFYKDFPDAIISIGDTPSCSIARDFNGADEIRPGNFVFYDVMQSYLGSCKVNDIAVALACPVVAKHPGRNEIVIYGGAVHLSKEFVLNNKKNKVYGLVVKLNQNGWSEPIPGSWVSNLSQEHGIIKVSKKLFESLNIGEIVGVLPVHSCLAANLANNYKTVNGDIINKL